MQQLTINDALAGKDVCGKAKTGSGKTLAFGLPALQRIGDLERGHIHGLILVPTRELATQVVDELGPLGESLGLKTAAIYGGADIEKQIAQINKGLDLVVATPAG
ncbi:MAG: DEAD/DEAH box helicase [Acidimicrobiales bacterium]